MKSKKHKLVTSAIVGVVALIIATVTSSLPIHATDDVKFYLTPECNITTDNSVRLYTLLEKPYGSKCTQAGISVYLGEKEVVSYTEGFGAYGNYEMHTSLPINYTIGSNCEVSYPLAKGTTYSYKIECYVEGSKYVTETGTFTTPSASIDQLLSVPPSGVINENNDDEMIKLEENYLPDLITNPTTVPESPSEEVTTPAPVDESYKGWSQSDTRWGDMTLGTDPTATMKDYGCLVMSYCKLAIQAGVKPVDYTPDKFLADLNNRDAFIYGGYLKSVEEITAVIPEVTYYKTITDMSSWCVDCYNLLYNSEEHYEIIMQTQTIYGNHYMLVDRTNKTDQVYVNNSWWDPASNISVPFTSVSTSYTPTALIVLKVDVDKSDNRPVIKDTLPTTQVQIKTINETAVKFAPFNGETYTIYSLKADEYVTVSNKYYINGEYWYQTSDGKYISAEDVLLVEVEKENATTVIVIKENAPIRSNPHNKGEVIAKSSINSEFKVLDSMMNYKGNYWYKVALEDGSQGFIYSENVIVK